VRKFEAHLGAFATVKDAEVNLQPQTVCGWHPVVIKEGVYLRHAFAGCFCFLIHFRLHGRREVRMAYYKVRIEVWCDWNPAESDLDEIAQSMGVGEAICTMREVVAVVNRPQDIEDEEAMSFFGGSEGDADESQG
jgi:hypothetical protein